MLYFYSSKFWFSIIVTRLLVFDGDEIIGIVQIIFKQTHGVLSLMGEKENKI